jgi:plastocyanin
LLGATGLGHLSAAEVAFKITEQKGGAPVTDAVVSLVPLDAVTKPAPPTSSVEIVQKGQEFSPYVTAIFAGTRVVFPNLDTVQHTIYSSSKPKEFEFVLYDPGKSESLAFEKPGLIAIGCNIHDWMLSFVLVLDTPWFAKTPATGGATVANVPPGRYRAEVWHPRMAKAETKIVTVTDGTTTSVPFALTLGRDPKGKRKVQTGSGGYK